MPIVVPSTGSTMVDVAALAAEGAVEGTVVIAEEQTAGRGRRGREWQSALHAGLWMSVLLRPPDAASRIGWLPLVAGVAVARGIAAATGLGGALKWPNDVVVVGPHGPLKVAGLLAERISDGAVIVGIGINVDHMAEELPDGGTSIRSEGAVVAREIVLADVLAALAVTYRGWVGGHEIQPAYEELSATLGARVRVETVGGHCEGRAEALGPGGELIVVDDRGAARMMSAGDVIHLRPAP